VADGNSASDAAKEAQALGAGIAAAAALIALGNVASRVMGQARESVIAAVFGADPAVSAYRVASAVPTQLYDLLVAGMITAALVPVLSGLAERDRAALWRTASSVFNLTLLLLASLAGMAALAAPSIAGWLAPGFADDPALVATLVRLIRWMLLAVLLMGLAGLCTALLQAQRRFLLPAFSSAVFNVGIVAGALLLAPSFGITALAIGMLLGAAAQVALQLPGLRGLRYRPALDLADPGLRLILRLYWPVAIGTSFSLVGTLVDRRLATLTGAQSAAYMGYATTLIQFALGLIAAAISLAALPTLSRQDDDPAAFRQTLNASLKSVLLLILPATALLTALAGPTVTLLFRHGAFNAEDARVTTLALLVYLPSLAAAAIDQPLIFAFYARRRTLLPNLVQGLAVACYLVVALSTWRMLGMYGLILGNVAQWVAHALIMLWLSQRVLGALDGRGLAVELGKGLLASAGCGLAALAVAWPLGLLGAGKGVALLQLLAGGALGALVYGALCTWLGVELWGNFVAALRRRLAR
jgi:putative peptidoglycan lipid II flippase